MTAYTQGQCHMWHTDSWWHSQISHLYVAFQSKTHCVTSLKSLLHPPAMLLSLGLQTSLICTIWYFGHLSYSHPLLRPRHSVQLHCFPHPLQFSLWAVSELFISHHLLPGAGIQTDNCISVWKYRCGFSKSGLVFSEAFQEVFSRANKLYSPDFSRCVPATTPTFSHFPTSESVEGAF